ncbi:integrase [Bacillus toyonensis]|uniref:Integrase n=1 Tax=Bacillus cereus TaxID=1396 RepID=A0A2B3U0L4_BACCE|nr:MULTISPECIES: tyrosine-type recombinase/integrase [Bacillus cereus group]PED62710.1 integrase [Bacillus toyonensis]PEN35454.1 integrase [Bacillus toyonensis]PFU40194.1 integrase [Bacillus cereus]PHE85442.1 integrase [Bacillus toyonensis]
MSDFEFQIENFMLYCTSKNLSVKTLKSYEQTLKLFSAYIKNEFDISEVDKVKSAHIRHYIKYLRERGKYTVTVNEKSATVNFPHMRDDYRKPLSTTTISNYIRNIKVFFNYLYEVEREIRKNPVEAIESIKPSRKKKPLLSKEELQKVMRTFDNTTFHGYRDWLITRLILDTGMRIGECLALTPDVIDFKTKSILIENPKNNQQRYVYFSQKISRELKNWLLYRDRYSNSFYLFPTIRGTQLEIRNFERTLRLNGKKVGVDIHPHQLRNNFAKYYLLNGGDFVTLSHILGHSSVEVTQKAYLDFTDGEIGRKYQRHSPLSHLDI